MSVVFAEILVDHQWLKWGDGGGLSRLSYLRQGYIHPL